MPTGAVCMRKVIKYKVIPVQGHSSICKKQLRIVADVIRNEPIESGEDHVIIRQRLIIIDREFEANIVLVSMETGGWRHAPGLDDGRSDALGWMR